MEIHNVALLVIGIDLVIITILVLYFTVSAVKLNKEVEKKYPEVAQAMKAEKKMSYIYAREGRLVEATDIEIGKKGDELLMRFNMVVRIAKIINIALILFLGYLFLFQDLSIEMIK